MNMIKRRRWILTGALLFLTTTQTVDAQDHAGKATLLENFLYKLGQRYPVQFTLEWCNKTEHTFRPAYIDVSQVKLDANDSTQQIVDKLNRGVEAYRFARNEKNPRVVHVIEKRLDTLKGYALKKKLSLDFEGTPHQLNRKLHALFPAVKLREHGDWREAGDDDMSQITLHADNLPVRDILTNGSDWKSYGPIIWRAETKLDTKNAIVQFRGALRKN